VVALLTVSVGSWGQNISKLSRNSDFLGNTYQLLSLHDALCFTESSPMSRMKAQLEKLGLKEVMESVQGHPTINDRASLPPSTTAKCELSTTATLRCSTANTCACVHVYTSVGEGQMVMRRASQNCRDATSHSPGWLELF
jgi:hypothetical protein